MVELFPNPRREELRLSNIKNTTLEYRALDHCKTIINLYQRRVEEYEADSKQHRSVSGIDYFTDGEGLHKAIITLQLLLDVTCLPRGCNIPRTLEFALREAGMVAGDIEAEVNGCREYLQKARSLKQKMELTGKQAGLAYDPLTARYGNEG